jgi:hypothetical protein
MEDIGKLLIVTGVVIVGVGVLVWLLAKVPGLGHLPGDIRVETENVSCVFPIVTCIVLSVVLSVIGTIALNVIARLSNR